MNAAARGFGQKCGFAFVAAGFLVRVWSAWRAAHRDTSDVDGGVVDYDE